MRLLPVLAALAGLPLALAGCMGSATLHGEGEGAESPSFPGGYLPGADELPKGWELVPWRLVDDLTGLQGHALRGNPDFVDAWSVLASSAPEGAFVAAYWDGEDAGGAGLVVSVLSFRTGDEAAAAAQDCWTTRAERAMLDRVLVRVESVSLTGWGAERPELARDVMLKLWERTGVGITTCNPEWSPSVARTWTEPGTPWTDTWTAEASWQELPLEDHLLRPEEVPAGVELVPADGAFSFGGTPDNPGFHGDSYVREIWGHFGWGPPWSAFQQYYWLEGSHSDGFVANALHFDSPEAAWAWRDAYASAWVRPCYYGEHLLTVGRVAILVRANFEPHDGVLGTLDAIEAAASAAQAIQARLGADLVSCEPMEHSETYPTPS